MVYRREGGRGEDSGDGGTFLCHEGRWCRERMGWDGMGEGWFGGGGGGDLVVSAGMYASYAQDWECHGTCSFHFSRQASSFS